MQKYATDFINWSDPAGYSKIMAPVSLELSNFFITLFKIIVAFYCLAFAILWLCYIVTTQVTVAWTKVCYCNMTTALSRSNWTRYSVQTNNNRQSKRKKQMRIQISSNLITYECRIHNDMSLVNCIGILQKLKLFVLSVWYFGISIFQISTSYHAFRNINFIIKDVFCRPCGLIFIIHLNPNTSQCSFNININTTYLDIEFTILNWKICIIYSCNHYK